MSLGLNYESGRNWHRKCQLKAQAAAREKRDKPPPERAEKPKQKPLKACSDKRKEELKEYSRLAKAHKKVHPFCFRCLQYGKSIPVSQTHHLRGREGKLLTDARFFMSLCFTCHRWVHDNPEQARTDGFLGSKFRPVEEETDG